MPSRARTPATRAPPITSPMLVLPEELVATAAIQPTSAPIPSQTTKKTMA